VVLAREGGALPKLLQGFQLGIGTYFAPGAQGFSWIHIHDVVRVLLWAIAHPAVSGPHNVCAPHLVSARQLSEALRQHKRAFLLLPVLKGPLYWLYGDLADTLHKGQYAVPERLSKAGFAFTFPTIEAALADLVGSR
jgi:NAD dependent epimerase/dehydratase family enzyme